MIYWLIKYLEECLIMLYFFNHVKCLKRIKKNKSIKYILNEGKKIQLVSEEPKIFYCTAIYF